jgi:hypothetical protein
MVAGVIATTMVFITGCGDKDTKKVEYDDGIEEIQIEEIVVEDIEVEDIKTERTFIDDSYEEELEYNSRVNYWGDNATYWD